MKARRRRSDRRRDDHARDHRRDGRGEEARLEQREGADRDARPHGIVARLGKDAVEGLYGIGGWQIHDAGSKDAGAQKFLAAYKAKFNADADENAANAYSYTDWFIAILQAAGRNLTADGFAKAAPGVGHQDFTTYSRQTFSANHVSPEYAGIDLLKGGRWETVAPAMSGMVK